MPLSEFLIQEIVAGNDMDTMEGRARALHGQPWCAAMSPSALRVQILKRLEQITQMSEGDLKTFLAVTVGQRGPAGPKSGRDRVFPVHRSSGLKGR